MSTGTVSDATDDGNVMRFRMLVSKTITYTQEIEVAIDNKDEVTYRPL